MIVYGKELYHFGVKGQKWGDRQYQYEDGSLTPEGREHYGYGKEKTSVKKELTRGEKRKLKNAKAKEIISSNKTHSSKARALSKNGSYMDASREYEKSSKTKAKLAAALNLSYPVLASIASDALGKQVVAGKMNMSTAKAIGAYSNLGKRLLVSGLSVSSMKDYNRSFKEMYKSYGYGR